MEEVLAFAIVGLSQDGAKGLQQFSCLLKFYGLHQAQLCQLAFDSRFLLEVGEFGPITHEK